jgi:hypothetical protein
MTQNQWQPIADAPANTEVPLTVWLPKRRISVSAFPFNVVFAEDGNTITGWDGWPKFGMTDFRGNEYGMELAESPSHFMQPEPPTEVE